MTDCMLYAGYLDNDGYGHVSQWHDSTQLSHLIHRIVYENHFGAIPTGKEVDHICRTRCCMNIDHLRAVTHKENCQNRPKHCNNGYCRKGLHKLSEDNLMKWTNADGSLHWKCKECYNARILERKIIKEIGEII